MKRNTGKYILFTSTNFPEGGAGASYLSLFCRGLKAYKADVKVFLLKGHAFGDVEYKGPRNGVTQHGISFSYLGFRQRSSKGFFKIVDQIVSFLRLQGVLLGLTTKRRNVTILLYNSDLFFNVSIHLIARIAGIRLVKFAAEIIDKSQYKKSIFGQISRAAYLANFRYMNKISDKLLVFSHYLKNEFIRMGVEEERIFVQPNLTDFDFWKISEQPARYTIGYSGAPYMKDGLSDLMKAIALLAAKGIEVSLLIVGDATFGRSLIPDIKKECDNLGIDHLVTFTGLVNMSEVKSSLSQCGLLAITRPDTVQTRAGFPTKLGEYFAMGKPILATRFGDMERYFTDRVDIIFAECGDPGSISERIEWMINNGDETQQVAQQGYRTARELLEFNSGMKRVIDFLIA